MLLFIVIVIVIVTVIADRYQHYSCQSSDIAAVTVIVIFIMASLSLCRRQAADDLICQEFLLRSERQRLERGWEELCRVLSVQSVRSVRAVLGVMAMEARSMVISLNQWRWVVAVSVTSELPTVDLRGLLMDCW